MSEWISVEDRLPENPEDIVLTICNDSISDWMHPYSPQQAMTICFYSNGHWWDEAWPEECKEDNIVPDVTHWMPLPEPPKE